MDFTIKCRFPTLCPRPETEELVEYVFNDIKSMGVNDSLRVLDIGSGTGVIGLALARAFPNASITAIDKCEKSVQLSNENAKLLGIDDSRYVALISSAKEFVIKDASKFDFIISNPPYIPLQDMPTLTKDVIEFEDFDALCGGCDGLNVVRDIISNLPNWLNPKGCCWMEVDTSHPILIRDWLGTSDAVKFVEFKKDFCDRDRFVKLCLHQI